MKRKNNLYQDIYHRQNILDAHKSAKKGKSKHYEVKRFEENLTDNINNIHNTLKNKEYKTSNYKIVERLERGKKRVIYKLPYNQDRIVHHCLMQVVKPIIESIYIKDTYQSIKGRGIHKAKNRLQFFLKDRANTAYCLKIDISKYYPSVNNGILKNLIRKKIKCKDTLSLIDEIVDSTKGLPIGNYSSQTFGNFYLSYFDHWIKEECNIKYYMRYADDMIFLHSDKNKLHELKRKIVTYLKDELDLELKPNSQIFKVSDRGIDYLGFKFFHSHILLRNSIKKAFVKKTRKAITKDMVKSIVSYLGWIKSCDAYNLLRKTFTKEILDKIKKYSKKVNIVIIPKKKVLQYRYYQPTLF